MPFLHTYGVGDQPPYDEDKSMRMLVLKDEEINQLKQEITHLKRLKNLQSLIVWRPRRQHLGIGNFQGLSRISPEVQGRGRDRFCSPHRRQGRAGRVFDQIFGDEDLLAISENP